MSKTQDGLKTAMSGRVIIRPGLNIREHEIRGAQALANKGLIVEFIPESDEPRTTSPDLLINGVRWEMKSPTASSAKALERNLRKALHQSENVIIDCRRMKKMPEEAVLRELKKLAVSVKGIKCLIMIGKSGNIVDIK